MRTIIIFIFTVLLALTAKAQTIEFDFDCVAAYNAEIAAIPEAMQDDPNGPLFDRVAYINNIITPDGFSLYANEERITVYEGENPQNGLQRWYTQSEVNYISYLEFNVIYKLIHRVLINLKYGYEPLYGFI